MISNFKSQIGDRAVEAATRSVKGARADMISHAEQNAAQPTERIEAATLAVVEADKMGSATSPLDLSKTLAVVGACASPRAGDVVVVRALTDSATYNQLELTTGRRSEER